MHASPGADLHCDSVTRALQRLTTILLAVLTLCGVHIVLYHCSSILVPFVLSAFIVLAVEPTTEIMYNHLAGRVFPHRWCCCCCHRRKGPSGRISDDDDVLSPIKSCLVETDSEDAEAAQPLFGDETSDDSFWEGVCRLVAVTLTLVFIHLILFLFITLLVRGATRMKENWESYQLGLQKLVGGLDSAALIITKKMNLGKELDSQIKRGYGYFFGKIEDMVSVLLNTIVSSVSGGIWSFVVCFLYVLFWLMRPLPIGGRASALVRSYIWKKALVSMLYGTWVSLLFLGLGQDLALFFGLVSFFLNFVPEVGAIISILLPIPIILLDGRLPSPFLTVGLAVGGQLVLKLVINNVLEVKLVEQDEDMKIHPVWVLLGLNYFGYVWGPIGMLISVPLMAMLKSALLSVMDSGDAITSSWAEGILKCLEGRRKRVEQRRKSLLLQQHCFPGQEPFSEAQLPPQRLSIPTLPRTSLRA